MSKPLKWGAIIGGLLILILVILVLVLPSLINLDRIKALAEEKATETLGRQVSINDVGFGLLTGPRIRLAGLSISGNPAFGEEDFVRLGSFDLKVRFWPLLKGRAEVDHIVLVDPAIRVMRDAKSAWNFDDILAAMQEEGIEKEGPGDEPGGAPPVSFLARDIRITGGQVFLKDATNERLKKGLSLQGITVDLRDVSLDRPMAMTASAGIGRPTADLKFAGTVGPVGEKPDPASMPMDLNLEVVSLDLTRLEELAGPLPFRIAGTLNVSESLSGTLSGGLTFEQEARFEGLSVTPAEGPPLVENLSGSVTQRGLFDGGKMAVRLERFEAKADRAEFTGSGTVTNLGGSPVMDLRLESRPVPLEGWDRVFPVIGPMARLSGDLSFTGSLKGTLGKDLAARMEFSSKKLEIDRGPALRDTGKPAAEKTAEAPYKPMEKPPLKVSGRVSVAEGRFEKVNFTDLTADLSQRGTRFSLDGMTLTAFGGGLAGSAWADLGTDPVAYGSSLKTDRVQMDDVLATFTGLRGILFGEVTSDLALTGKGTALDQLRKFLTGDGSIKVSGGRFTSANLLGGAQTAASLLGLSSSGEKETAFDSMDASFSIANGKIRIGGMDILTRDWGMKGSGSIGMDSSLALSSRMTLTDAMTARIPENRRALFPKDSSGRLQIPLKISGTVTSPKFGLDSDLMKAAAKQQLEQKVLGDKEKTKEDLEEKLEKSLGDRLKKLF